MRSRESTVLVTGGLGYIGSYVVTRLVDAGWKVRIADNRYRSDPAVEARLAQLDGVEIHEVDVRYRGAVDRVMQGCEAVVHLAAVCLNKSISDPTESFDVNLMGTQHVVESAVAHGVRRVIYASSASVYGNPTRLPMAETDLPAPITPYCIAKLAGGMVFTGTQRHFVQYRDAAAPFGYDATQLISTDAALALYHDKFTQVYEVDKAIEDVARNPLGFGPSDPWDMLDPDERPGP